MSMIAHEGVPTFNAGVNGQYKSADTAVHAGPNASARYFRIQAKKGNTGSIYLGLVAGTTSPTGATDTTSGTEFAPGDVDLFPINNLQTLFCIAANSGDGYEYIGFA